MTNQPIYISCCHEKLQSFDTSLHTYHFFDYGLTGAGIAGIEQMNHNSICGYEELFDSWREHCEKLLINEMTFEQIINHLMSIDDNNQFKKRGSFCPDCIERLIKFLKDEMNLDTDMDFVKKLEDEAKSKSL